MAKKIPKEIFEGSIHDPNFYTILQGSQRHINFESYCQRILGHNIIRYSRAV